MEAEDDRIIEVYGVDVSIDSESISAPPESIYWFSAAETRHRLKLDKTPFRNLIEELLTVHSIPESAIRRGRARATAYSQLTIALVRALKSGDRKAFDSLKQSVVEPPAPVSTLTISEYTPALDRRISQFGQNAATNSATLNQSVMQVLAQIAAENQSAQQRDADLNQARINAAQNRGAANALAIFQAEQKAQNEVLAQLRASQLGGLE